MTVLRGIAERIIVIGFGKVLGHRPSYASVVTVYSEKEYLTKYWDFYNTVHLKCRLAIQ